MYARKVTRNKAMKHGKIVGTYLARTYAIKVARNIARKYARKAAIIYGNIRQEN